MNVLRLLCTVSVLALTACGDEEEGATRRGPELRPGRGSLSVTNDSALTEEEREAVDGNLTNLGLITIDGNQIRWFNEIFGGPRSSNVNAYFDERVKFLLSSTTDFLDRTLVDGEPVESERAPAPDPRIAARNLGAGLWLSAKALEPSRVQFLVNGTPVDVTSARVGIVQLGAAYARTNEVEQLSVLVHEARHSDCTGGLHASDLERIRNDEAPRNNLCTHLHTRCPPGHELAGLFACDAHPWGAYSIESNYAATIALTCTSCNETARLVAEAITLSAVNRVLVNVEDMIDGRLGPPDMSSSDQVVSR